MNRRFIVLSALLLSCTLSFPVRAVTEKQKAVAETIVGAILAIGGGIGYKYLVADDNQDEDVTRRTPFRIVRERQGQSADGGRTYSFGEETNWQGAGQLISGVAGVGGIVCFLQGLYDLYKLLHEEETENTEDIE